MNETNTTPPVEMLPDPTLTTGIDPIGPNLPPWLILALLGVAVAIWYGRNHIARLVRRLPFIPKREPREHPWKPLVEPPERPNITLPTDEKALRKTKRVEEQMAERALRGRDAISRMWDQSRESLAWHIDRFLQSQANSEEHLRQMLEEHKFLGVDADGRATVLHLRAFTDDQLRAILPPDVAHAISSTRARGLTRIPVTVQAGGNGNGHHSNGTSKRQSPPARPKKPAKPAETDTDDDDETPSLFDTDEDLMEREN